MDGGFVISLHFFQERQILSPWFAIFAGNASEYVESDQAIKCDSEQTQRHKRICGSDPPSENHQRFRDGPPLPKLLRRDPRSPVPQRPDVRHLDGGSGAE